MGPREAEGPGRGATDVKGQARAPWTLAASAWLCMMLAGCTVEEVTVVKVSIVEVSPPSVRTVTGQETQMSAAVRDESGEILHDAVVSWGTTEPSIATVNAAGLLVAHAPGWVDVHATFAGVSGSAPVAVAAP